MLNTDKQLVVCRHSKIKRLKVTLAGKYWSNGFAEGRLSVEDLVRMREFQNHHSRYRSFIPVSIILSVLTSTSYRYQSSGTVRTSTEVIIQGQSSI